MVRSLGGVKYRAPYDAKNSQSLEDSQVGYILPKYTLGKYTLGKFFLGKVTFEKILSKKNALPKNTLSRIHSQEIHKHTHTLYFLFW